MGVTLSFVHCAKERYFLALVEASFPHFLITCTLPSIFAWKLLQHVIERGHHILQFCFWTLYLEKILTCFEPSGCFTLGPVFDDLWLSNFDDYGCYRNRTFRRKIGQKNGIKWLIIKCKANHQRWVFIMPKAFHQTLSD